MESVKQLKLRCWLFPYYHYTVPFLFVNLNKFRSYPPIGRGCFYVVTKVNYKKFWKTSSALAFLESCFFFKAQSIHEPRRVRVVLMHSWLIPKGSIDLYISILFDIDLALGSFRQCDRYFRCTGVPVMVEHHLPGFVFLGGISQSKLWYVTCKKGLPYNYSCKNTRKPPSPTIWRYLRTWQVKVRTGRAEIAAESGKSVRTLKISLQEHHDIYLINVFCTPIDMSCIMTSLIARSSWATFVIPSIRMSEYLFGYTFYLWKLGCVSTKEDEGMFGEEYAHH